jgi:hypothetical protein
LHGVIFFVSGNQNQDTVGEKLAIACNKKKPFNDVVDALPLKATGKCKFRFTNLKNKQTCHGGESPDSVLDIFKN